MHIHGPTYLHGAQPINPPHRSAATQAAGRSEAAQPADQLDISPQANLVSQLREVPEIRADRVAQIRQQIASGTYDSAEKLNVALNRLLDEIA